MREGEERGVREAQGVRRSEGRREGRRRREVYEGARPPGLVCIN